MTEAELLTLLKTTNLPVAYDHFPTGVKVDPPFIMYYEAYDNNMNADNKVLFSAKHMLVEFYTSLRNLTAEGTIESGFTNKDIPYTKTLEYDDNQKLYIVTYEIEI